MTENLPDTNVGNIEYIRKHDALVALMDNDLDHIQAPNGKEAVQILSDIPAADVVPVVRCDDCVYYGSRRWCELHSSVFDDNAFCSYGERKE